MPMDRQSSSELSSLAARILNMDTIPDDTPTSAADYNVLLQTAKKLAGSVLSQDQTPGN